MVEQRFSGVDQYFFFASLRQKKVIKAPLIGAERFREMTARKGDAMGDFFQIEEIRFVKNDLRKGQAKIVA